MHPKNLLRKWPSVSTAAAMLLGLQRTEASTGEVDIASDLRKGDPVEPPLVLRPSKIKVVPGHLFAGHRSHSSHSSHSSGSSGGHASHASHSSGTSSGAYTPTTPNYVAPIPPRSTYPVIPNYSTPAMAPQASPRPTPSARPTTRIELTNGAVIYGTVLVKSAAGITLQGVDQKTYKIPRLILATSTVVSLALPPEQ